MELFPIYDENSKISPNIWYSLSGLGECPFMRVGHTIAHFKEEPTTTVSKKGKLYIIGGANPSGSFNDLFQFDMDTLSWDKFEDLENFEKGRYEHACFVSEVEHKKIYIFGGSNEECSLNDMLEFDMETKTCTKVKNESPGLPSPRTCHVSVSFKNQLIVFGGGMNGKTAVLDQKVYIYNPTNNKWISLSLQGKTPETRHGHLMLNHNDDAIYLNGGMSDSKMFDDLWKLDLRKFCWQEIDFKSTNGTNYPCSRAAHGGVGVNNNLYVFGGLGSNGLALDDLWKYDIDSNQWSVVEIFGYKPPSRLDFAYCKMKFNIRKSISDESELNKENDEEKEACFMVIHGGMDTEGNVFDDLYFINLE